MATFIKLVTTLALAVPNGSVPVKLDGSFNKYTSTLAISEGCFSALPLTLALTLRS